MVETLAEIKEDIAEKDYDSARKKTTETIASLFFSSSTKPTFSTDSPFLRKIASTSDPRELTTLLSSALELVDIYSKLHRYSVPVSDPWSPDIVLEELQAFFPGHLAARSAIELIHRTPETVDFIHAYGHYGNPEFKSYDEGNLEGRVSGSESTFVNTVVSNLDLAPEGGRLHYFLTACHMFIRDCPTKPVSIIVTENETNLSKSQRDHYLAIMGSLDAQSRLIITDHISYLMDGGCTIISKKNELIPFLESIKVQYDLNQGVMTKFAKNLPDLLMNMGEEIFNVVLASKGYRFLGDFEKFEKNIYAVRDELERFLEDDSIDISYRNRDQLVSSLIKYNVDIYHNASSFFERLKWTIEFGNRFKAGTAGNYWEENDVKVHAETIDEAVDCARWDLGNEHGLLSYRGEGGFMRVYVGIKKSGRQYPRKGDFRAIKIPEDGKRGEELARRSGTEIEDKPDDLPESLNIKHDNLCLCHSHTAPDGMLYFEEELFFETMEERVERKTYSITQAKRALLEIVHPLKKCADNELIHADIKPDNIGYKDNRHMVCDFGIATFLGEVRKLGQANIGSLVGLAPELYKPQDGETPTGHQDIRSEMFSLGVVLFYSVFGEYHYFVPPDQAANLGLDGEYGSIGKTDIHFTPGNGRTQSENKLLDLKKDQEFYSQTIELFRRKTNADRMTNVLQKLLNPDPEQRYQRFDDLITDLKT